MKIVYITSTSYSDTDFPLIRELVKNGNEIYLFINVYPTGLRSTLIDIKNQYPKQGVFDSSIYGDSIDFYKNYLGIKKIYIINRLSSKFISFNSDLYKQQKSIIEKIVPDIIHCIGWLPMEDTLMMFRYRKKMVITIHDPVPHETTSKSIFLRWFRIFTSVLVKKYILLNKAQAKAFCAYYKKKESFIYFSRIGNLDVMELFGKHNPQCFRSILFYGRISRYKGVDVLLQAFCKIKKQFDDVKLIIAGKGNFYFDVSPYINDEQIIFKNEYITLEDLGTMIRNCEFCLCPYTSATQSGVVATSLALGKPLIVTNVGGLPSMIDNGHSGIVVEPNNVEGLASAIESLLSNQSKLDEMSNYIIKDNLDGGNSWSTIVKDYVDIYHQIITNPSC